MKLKLLLQILILSSVSFMLQANTSVANATAVSVVQNVGTIITLTGTTDNPNLTFAIVSGPSHGALTGLTQVPTASATIVYTSTGSYIGADSFTFHVTNNLGLVSSTVTVSIMILPPSTRAYLTDYDGGVSDVSIINVTTGISAGDVTDQPDYGTPYGFAVTPDGAKAYVCYPNGGTSGKISVINTATNATIGDVIDGSGNLNNPQSIAFSPDGTKGYVCNLNNRTISILNPLTDTIAALNVSDPSTYINGPVAIAFTPDGTRAYVANAFGSASVSMIDVASNTVTVSISASSGGLIDLVLSPDGNFGYLIGQIGGSASVGVIRILDINPSSGTYNTFVGTVNDSGFSFYTPYAMGISPNGLKAYVLNISGSDYVSIVDLNPASGTYRTVIGNVSGGTFNDPESVAFTADGTKAYVSNYAGGGAGAGSVSVVTVSSNSVTGTILGYTAPAFVAFLGDAAPVATTTALAASSTGGAQNYTLGASGGSGLYSTYTITGATSAHGTISQPSGTGSSALRYTPTSGTGTDTFSYTVTDSLGIVSASQLVTITVSAPDTPVANPSAVTTFSNTPITINLSGSDLIGTPITAFSIVASPSHGTLGSIVQTGDFTAQVRYTPTNSYFGSDTFTFKVNNGITDSDPATVSITIFSNSLIDTFVADMIAKYSGT